MSSPPSETPGAWLSEGSTSIVPPPDYWVSLAGSFAAQQLEELRRQSDRRLTEFRPSGLPPPEDTAVELLERVADHGWVARKVRRTCPNCSFELSQEEAGQTACPECGEAFIHHGGVSTEPVYVRTLAPSRNVDWVIAIHGMNTRGAWQEEFSWYLATTWGPSVPVAVYKYGIVIAGVVMAWRRRKLRDGLRYKLAVLRDQARAQGFLGNPDVIAHSFGTWLLGHLLEAELRRGPEEQLMFGRIILTGCVLRPDFDWKSLKDAGIIEDVLNHYGTKDLIVPLAQATIWDSGPSGRLGFDGDGVINIRAEGYGHSDLLSIKKCVVDGQHLHDCTSAADETCQLEQSYKRYWRPFLTLPADELGRLPNRDDPKTPWRQLPWPLRGTLFPLVALPLFSALGVLLGARLGGGLSALEAALSTVALVSGLGLASLAVAIAITAVWRRLGRYCQIIWAGVKP